MKTVKKYIIPAIFLLMDSVAQAAPGDFDTAFGSGSGSISISSQNPSALIQQSDGKLVVSMGGTPAIRRYNRDGSSDTSFAGCSVSGFSMMVLAPGTASSLVQQQNLKIIVIGQISNQIAMLRCNRDGTLDTSFGASGVVTTQPVAGKTSWPNGVLQTPDGKLIALGNAAVGGSSYQWVVARYDSNGNPDTSFNGNGMLVLSTVGGVQLYQAYSMIRQRDGKLVLTGYSIVGGYIHATVIRLNNDGSVDTTFNGNGIEASLVGETYGVMQQRDGKLLAFSSGGGLWRYNDNGTFDTTFGGTGIINAQMTYTRAAIQQHDGKIVVAGYTPTTGLAIVNRFNLDGTLDTTFNGAGSKTFSGRGFDLVQQADGKLMVLAGNTTNTAGMLVRLLNDDVMPDRVKSDFDDDKKSDALFVNPATGGAHYWRDADKTQAVYPGSFDTSYNYTGSGDFDGDGKADILFSRSSDNATLVWSGAVKSAAQYPGKGNDGFSVAANCDITGDGKEDLVWTNPSTGGVVIWPGAEKVNVIYPGAQVASYSVAACADFDGDGHADIFWRNTTTGANEIWLGANKANKIYPGSLPDMTWKIVGAGDIAGDGHADVVWYKPSTGAIQIWNDGVKSAATFPGLNNTAFAPVAIRDYDGDGKADLLWTNPATNQTQIWHGTVKASVTYPGTMAPGFSAQK